MKILVTGGAGFIGLPLVKKLSSKGHTVVVIDNLLAQVHGKKPEFPEFSPSVVAFRVDIRDKKSLKKILAQRFDMIFHLASLTGVGQSMYQIHEYVEVNTVGTAALLDAIVEIGPPYPKIILSSSRAIYGEGTLKCRNCGEQFNPDARSVDRMVLQHWEHSCPQCGSDSDPLPSTEMTPARPSSIYALTKLNQEQLCNVIGDAYEIPIIVLRYFNVYGPGQSPSNPYTGILSIFSRRLLNNQILEVYEDGLEMRDFVYIDDVVQANLLTVSENVIPGTYNICAGENKTIFQVAELLTHIKGKDSSNVVINGKFRVGDIRHGIGSWSLAEKGLGYIPKYNLQDGLKELLIWVENQRSDYDVDLDKKAESELIDRGLLR